MIRSLKPSITPVYDRRKPVKDNLIQLAKVVGILVFNLVMLVLVVAIAGMTRFMDNLLWPPKKGEKTRKER